MNNKHWEKFYSKVPGELDPSAFAVEIQRVAGKKKKLIYDLGCGNGRDSLFFAESGHDVIAVDPFGKPYTIHNNMKYWKANVDDFIKDLKGGRICSQKLPTVIYSRFFIHAIEKEKAVELINALGSKTYFIAEFRIKGDEPKIYKDHERTFWDPGDFADLFNNKDWERCNVWVGTGAAKYKDEDPLVMRIIAKKK